MITIDGLHNFRDTGGMPLAGGRQTRSGVLFRADSLSTLTDTGVEQLAASPVGVIVDLRTASERRFSPNRVPSVRSLRTVHLSLLDHASIAGPQSVPVPDPLRWSMEQPDPVDNYLLMLERGADAFATIARLIAASNDDAPTAVLVHCTAGKDRTGISVALMLDAAGVDRDAIVADYASSQTYLAGAGAEKILAVIAQFGATLTPKVIADAAATPPAMIERTLTWIDDQGGAAAYLRSGGLTDAELTALRERIIG